MKYPPVKTPLLELPELRTYFGFPNLYVKDESKQRFGTWKDRRSRLIVEQARTKGIRRLVMITSGNSGYSLAKFAREKRISVSLVIDRRISISTKRRLKSAGALLIEQDLSKKIFTSKELIALSRKNNAEKIWDVTNGFEDAFISIVDEVKRLKPQYIICPVGSGEGFIGIARGIRRHKLKTHLIGVAPKSRKSLADKLVTPWTPYAKTIDKLSRNGAHSMIRVPERLIKDSYQIAKRFFRSEPSSAIVLAALRIVPLEKDAVILLMNSGKGD